MKAPFVTRAPLAHRLSARWRGLGVLALLAFSIKGVVTSSLIVWALLRSWA